MKKYELTEEVNEQGLHRIRALRDIPRYGVKKGDLGGFVEKENNLSQESDCWIADDATVKDFARVCDTALIMGNATVTNDATVRGYAIVKGYVRVKGNAEIRGNVIIG